VVSIDPELADSARAAVDRPDPVASTAVDRDRLVRLIATLPLTLRSVVVLHDVYDLSHDEIATQLEISSAVSRVRLHRARRQLRSTGTAELVVGNSALVEPAGATDGDALAV